jgi:hypothetical protein
MTAALIAQLTGCSLLLLDRAPPNVPPGVWVHCDDGKAWPVVDSLIGVTQVIGAVGIGATVEDPEDRAAAKVIAPMYALIGVAFLYSAYVGFRETSRCTQIREDAAARGIYGPPPYPPYPHPPSYPPYPHPHPPPPPAPHPPPPNPSPAPPPPPPPAPANPQ